MSSIEDTVLDCVSMIYKVDKEELGRDTRFLEDLFTRSIQIMELIAMLEYRFDIEIPTREVRQNRTIGQAIDYVVRKVEGKRGGGGSGT